MNKFKNQKVLIFNNCKKKSASQIKKIKIYFTKLKINKKKLMN